MIESINRFYKRIDDAEHKSQSSMVELFVYFITIELGQDVASPREILECFRACDLNPPNVTARLSEGFNQKPKKYLKVNGGYKLERQRREMITAQLGEDRPIIQTSAALRSLENRLSEAADRAFLKEAIDCFEIGANRAAIVMTWILTLDHLFSYILTHKLPEFNAALALNNDKSIKVKRVLHRDDFSDIKEVKFIEFCRQSKIISNDVRKILEQKLDIRNSCAHPSGIAVSRMKAIEFVDDLIENVVIKYVI